MNVPTENLKYINWPNNYGDPQWFIHDRFGLFIHFGLYSAGARHEWFMTREKIDLQAYKKYFDYFNPDLLHAKQWAQYAKKAGVKYVVITTKHHEGFALWDSKLTEYKVTNTVIKRDLLYEVVEAMREEGLKIGFYHSLIDWNHPDFIIDGLHPLRDDVSKRSLANRNMDTYIEYLKGQIRELLTNYGEINYLWFDFSYSHRDWGWAKGKGAVDWRSEELEKLVLELQPNILLNDRLDLNRGIMTPEQFQPNRLNKENNQPVIWEACQTMNGSWGYHRDNLNWKSSDTLLKMLIDTVSKNGNFLLNIGPNGRGEIDENSVVRLKAIGEWMRLHARSIYGSKQSEFEAPIDCRYTQRGSQLYLHIFSWPYKHIHVKGLAGRVSYCQFLHDASEVRFAEYDPKEVITSTETTIDRDSVVLNLPVQKPNVSIPVIELFLK
ncbi:MULTISPECIES: alpha-L-fucosidase [Virgibacillus]|uniref:alpha-L-fucosidase n=1 Tax=Virgibacillus TaxID=84406 RepID=UPI0003889A87|nr:MULTISPECIES: alpha-L-fucosidase [Virgibacillus]EQB38087.1 hypothetical protein M948_05810 [Virgibacillus sp. CM-4]